VHSEVDGIDILAKKEEDMIAVEMKTGFNLKLVYQLIERRKIVDKVYAYVPLGKGGRWPKEYKRMCGLLKRLECGLITLDIRNRQKIVTVEFEPGPYAPRKNYAKKKSAVREFDGRSLDLNKGGSRSELLFTAYKEKAIRLALYLYENGPSTTKKLTDELQIEHGARILQNNHNFWFDRVSRGIYQITPEFEKFLMSNRKKIEKYHFSPHL
ncbi:MAG: DUF2161 domain-containing phosphodiesterase, partial [Candidatus Omnitrophica bacterium]|nr:DUF2161 domain-containing phosphodiesterase [Candidatus Omnitrophota bacterium]